MDMWPRMSMSMCMSTVTLACANLKWRMQRRDTQQKGPARPSKASRKLFLQIEDKSGQHERARNPLLDTLYSKQITRHQQSQYDKSMGAKAQNWASCVLFLCQ